MWPASDSNSKLNGAKSGWGANLGMGLFCAIIWGALYHFWPIWYVDIAGLVVLFAASYGALLGVLQALTNFSMPGASRATVLTKVAIFVAQATAFMLAVVQLLQIFKVIK